MIGFFLIPMITMFSVSLQEGSLETGYTLTGRWQTYLDALGKYDTQMIRSLLFGLIVTIATLVISYPMAYWLARHAGRKKTLILLLMLLPFFTPYLLRTISWQALLADEGVVLGTL